MKKISKSFYDVDLLPKEIIDAEGEYSARFISPVLLSALEQIVSFFGKVPIINNYAKGGGNSYRGFRPPSCTIGAKDSAHRYGWAADISIPGISDHDLRVAILENQSKMPNIKRMEENTVGWVHVDVKRTNQPKIILFPYQA